MTDRDKIELPPLHSVRLRLGRNGSLWTLASSELSNSNTTTICWTGDGRAWIDSERNRELAKLLRQGNSYAEIQQAADALDGGVR